MKRVLFVVAVVGALAIAAAPSSAQFAGTARLSWGTCDPQVQNVWLGDVLTAPRTIKLVLSVMGASVQNSGTDFTLYVGAGPLGTELPDAWRFDDAGCQTGAQIGFSPSGLSKACPPFSGPNNLAITAFLIADPVYNVGPQGLIRLANTYDAWTPDPAIRYTVWQVTFDHSYSDMVEPAQAPDSCAGGWRGISIGINTGQMLETVSGQLPFFDYLAPSDRIVTVNGGAEVVAIRPTTWGRVKEMYR